MLKLGTSLNLVTYLPTLLRKARYDNPYISLLFLRIPMRQRT